MFKILIIECKKEVKAWYGFIVKKTFDFYSQNIRIAALNKTEAMLPSDCYRLGKGRVEGMLGLVLFEKCFEMINLKVFKFDQQYLFCGSIPQQRSGPLYHTKYNT